MSILAKLTLGSALITTPVLADQDPLIATSELVKMASLAAKHDGYDLSNPNIYLDEVKGPDGPDPVDGYMSIAWVECSIWKSRMKRSKPLVFKTEQACAAKFAAASGGRSANVSILSVASVSSCLSTAAIPLIAVP